MTRRNDEAHELNLNQAVEPILLRKARKELSSQGCTHFIAALAQDVCILFILSLPSMELSS